MTLYNPLLIAASLALCACSGVRHFTYEIEYTTDQEPHTVQLWYEEARAGGEMPAYSLTFRQSYYAYRDNHEARKQTTIGLLLDRRTMKPLTELMAAATGISEPLDVPAWKEGPLKRLAAGRFADRQLFVTIRGLAPPASTDPASTYGQMYQKVGEQGRFTVYKVKVAANYPDRGLPEIVGFASGMRDVRFHCLSAVLRCSVDQPYRESTISISVQRSDLDQAPALMTAIRQVLDQHLA